MNAAGEVPTAGPRIRGFGENLQRAMEACGATQSNLALRIAERRGAEIAKKFSQPQVSRWLRGAVPTMDTLEVLAEELGVPWEWLLVGDEGAKRAYDHTQQRASPRQYRARRVDDNVIEVDFRENAEVS